MRIRGRPRSSGRVGMAAVVAALLLAGTGCGETDADEKKTGVAAALKLLPASVSGSFVTYADGPAVRKLTGADPELYAGYKNLLAPPLGRAEAAYEAPRSDREAFGFDRADVETAVGIDSDTAWFRGTFDVAAVKAALVADGFVARDEGGAVVLADAEAPGGPTWRVTTGEIWYSTEAVNLARAPEGGGASLADNPAYRAVAECLGDVYGAYFRPQNKDGAIELVGGGERVAGDGTSTTVLCVRATSAEAAGRAVGLIESQTGPDDAYPGAVTAVRSGDRPMVSMTVQNSDEIPPADLLKSSTLLLKLDRL